MFALERLDEPSGARPAAGPSTAAAGVPAADQQEDDDTAGDTDLPPEEYDSEDFYSDAVDYYMWKRDVTVSAAETFLGGGANVILKNYGPRFFTSKLCW